MTNATHYLHGVRMGNNKSKYSVWYRADMGHLNALTIIVDAERIDKLGRSFPCTEKEKEELMHYRHNAIPF